MNLILSLTAKSHLFHQIKILILPLHQFKNEVPNILKDPPLKN